MREHETCRRIVSDIVRDCNSRVCVRVTRKIEKICKNDDHPKKYQNFGVSLHRISKQNANMNVLSLAGTAAAYANYNKAKANYEALKERADSLSHAMQTYLQERQLSIQENMPDENRNDRPEGLLVSSILRIGELNQRFFKIGTTVVITNTSDKTYFIRSVEAKCSIWDIPVPVLSIDILGRDMQYIPQSVIVDKYIKPGETLDIELPKGVSEIINENGESLKENLKNFICEATGNKNILSVPKTDLNGHGLETANISISWLNDSNDHTLKNAFWNGKPGTLRYVGEVWWI